MKLTILASGSKANSAVLEAGSTRLLIDAGMSANQLRMRLEMAKIRPDTISAVCLTHEHADHSTGLAAHLRGNRRTLAYANAMTAQAVSNKQEMGFGWRCFDTGAGFQIGDIHVETMGVNHDAAEPVAFIFTHEGKALAFATDLGEVGFNVIERCQRATSLFIEANYSDVFMENDRSRPWMVRQRIMSTNGHLSNYQAGEAVADLPNVKLAILGHLSSTTNRPEAAIEAVRSLADRDLYNPRELEVVCAFVPECDRIKPPVTYDIL